MRPPYRVMTVCTGNICRSPIAEAVLRERFARAGLADAVVVDSAGTSDEEEGAPIDPRARSVLAGAGYPVPQHRAHQARTDELGQRDLVLAMTRGHARWLRAHAPDRAAADRVRLYRSFDPAAGPAQGAALDVEDPWYGDRSDFEAVLAQVEAAADAVVEHVRAALDGAGELPGTGGV